MEKNIESKKDETTDKKLNISDVRNSILKRIKTHEIYVEANKKRIANSNNVDDIKIYIDAINRCLLWINEDEAVLKNCF